MGTKIEGKKQEEQLSASRDYGNLDSPTYKVTPYQPKKDEEYMNDNQLEHFSRILNAWRKELLSGSNDALSEMRDTSILADMNDRATQEEAFNLKLRTKDRERKLLRKIESVIQLIKDKEYGYCESCGIEIGIRRLEARPTAMLCIDCKTIDEIREKRTK